MISETVSPKSYSKICRSKKVRNNIKISPSNSWKFFRLFPKFLSINIIIILCSSSPFCDFSHYFDKMFVNTRVKQSTL